MSSANTRKPCSIEGCERPHQARSLCSLHYSRWHDHGDALYKPPSQRNLVFTQNDAADIQRFVSSGKVTLLVKDLERSRWTGRPSKQSIRTMLGIFQIKKRTGAAWPKLLAALSDSEMMLKAVGCNAVMLPSVYSCYRFEEVMNLRATPEGRRQIREKAHLRERQRPWTATLQRVSFDHQWHVADPNGTPFDEICRNECLSIIGNLTPIDIAKLSEEGLKRLQDRLSEAGYAPSGITKTARKQQVRARGSSGLRRLRSDKGRGQRTQEDVEFRQERAEDEQRIARERRELRKEKAEIRRRKRSEREAQLHPNWAEGEPG